MSDAEELTAKAKKAKRSEERFKKNKKRKRDDQTEADNGNTTAPAEDEAYAPIIADDGEKPAPQARDKKRSERKASADEADEADETKEQSQPKKKRKSETAPAADKSNDETTEAAGDAADAAPASKQRFIVFIGNLPFSATDESIKEHFKSISPASIRHRTDPKTGKSKGFAFLEFASFDRMKTCLKLYHHSMFDSGKPGDKGRRINVELTAGGGGKSENRKQKLSEKNVRLEEQRKRRAEAMAKQEARKEKKGKGAKTDEGAPGKGRRNGETRNGEVEVVDAADGMHPARAAMMRHAR
ncbi:RNA recognition motif-containing protein 27 [Elsinoe fawcettii]|nr:RNA recognition motif-containing protein 27 [Elsinoe fawcettii]